MGVPYQVLCGLFWEKLSRQMHDKPHRIHKDYSPPKNWFLSVVNILRSWHWQVRRSTKTIGNGFIELNLVRDSERRARHKELIDIVPHAHISFVSAWLGPEPSVVRYCGITTWQSYRFKLLWEVLVSTRHKRLVMDDKTHPVQRKLDFLQLRWNIRGKKSNRDAT